ncbi:MAG: hypothetical protein FJ291_30955 [Planctomycetes bacterium]|nr:hypothetical protein [Planctomycetota bacterium]
MRWDIEVRRQPVGVRRLDAAFGWQQAGALRARALACACALAFLAPLATAVELARFEIKEPLGRDWRDEWLTQTVAIDFGGHRMPTYLLDLTTAEGESLPAQFYALPDGKLLDDYHTPFGKMQLKVLFKATIKKDSTARFVVTDQGKRPRTWEGLKIDKLDWIGPTGGGQQCTVLFGGYRFSFASPMPIPYIYFGQPAQTIASVIWPSSVKLKGVRDSWLEEGPARAVLLRSFTFENPAHRYEIKFDFRAGDPWIDITETYSLGKGSFLKLDLTWMKADTVYHPYAYNARTFRPGGDQEDTTLQPPQHPIATLGPIWRDIWYNGGPFAFIYKKDSDCGIGFAAVCGSEWTTPDGISPESQNLEVHGDKEKPGQVWVKLPTDGGHRRWAIVVGHPDIRKQMGSMVRSHADIPLDKVLKEWVLDWPSKHQVVEKGIGGGWFGHYNRHELNPTTMPRGARKRLNDLMAKGEKSSIKSRDLAFLADVFTDPNYWPGPKYKWKIGNPNFHTDMYNIPLKIGLLMPDHPHAKRWVDYGVEETRGNLMRDSYPGGAWAESLSYSGFFFHVVENARLLRDAGVLSPFKEWPRFKEVATYLACMHTPTDPRYNERQKAPIGDTSPGSYVKELNAMGDLYKGIDDTFAEQLARFPQKCDGALDLRSREFYGFGAMLRGNPYDDRNESFVTIKASPARNHYQGDELSFHFCSLGTPLAIDHACHYSPRPWSASMHNRPDMNGLRPVAVAARRAFATAPGLGSVFVADERTTLISHLPLEPHNTTKPGWEYPTSNLPADKPWTMRRYAMLVEHDPKRSQIADYLVLRDEIESPQPVWWNLHLLARDIQQQGQCFLFSGQLDADTTVHFLTPEFRDGVVRHSVAEEVRRGAAGHEVEKREWGWSKERKSGTLRNLKGEEYEKEHFGRYIPEGFERGTWGKTPEHSGEMTKWLRVKAPAGRTNWLVLIIPNLRGKPAPKVEKLSDASARITLGGESEVIHLGSDGKCQAAVERGDKLTVLLKPGDVKPWGELDFKPMPPNRVQ